MHNYFKSADARVAEFHKIIAKASRSVGWAVRLVQKSTCPLALAIQLYAVEPQADCRVHCARACIREIGVARPAALIH
jgi:hypothetical protein